MHRFMWRIQNVLATSVLRLFCLVMHPRYMYDGCSDKLSNSLHVWECRNAVSLHEHVRCQVCSSREYNTFGWSVDWGQSDEGWTQLYHNGHRLYGYPHESFQLDESDCWDEERWEEWHGWLAQVADECEWSAIWNVMYV